MDKITENLDELRVKLLGLASKIAPELDGVNHYLLFGEELGIVGKTTISGMAFPAGGETYQDRITNWRGPGYLIIVMRGQDKSELGIYLHELAHLLTGDLPDPRTLHVPEALIDSLRDYTKADFYAPVKCKPEWHDWRFWRVMLHLHRRALEAGIDIPSNELWDQSSPNHPCFLITALEPELKKYSKSRFSEFMNRDPPTEFLKKWPYWARK